MKTCKNCGEPEGVVEFPKWGQVCRTCKNAYAAEWYKINRSPYAKRASTKRTEARIDTRLTYDDIMLARLGFTVTACVTTYGGQGRAPDYCPLYAQCYGHEAEYDILPCELTNEELGIPEVVVNAPQPEDRYAMELWADSVAPMNGDLRAAIDDRPYLFVDMD